MTNARTLLLTALLAVGSAAPSVGCGKTQGPPAATANPRPILVIHKGGDPAGLADIVANLQATSYFTVQTFDAGLATGTASPGLSTLFTQDAVLVWGYGNFFDGDILGDDLKSYVDAGGGLVLSMLVHLGDYYPLTLNHPEGLGGNFDLFDYFAMPEVINGALKPCLGSVGMTADVPGDSILVGGGVFNASPVNVGLFGGGSCTRPDLVATQVTLGTVVATWNDAPLCAAAPTPLIVTRAIGTARRVDLGLDPRSAPTFPSGINGAAFQIVVNSLLWSCHQL